MYYALSIATVAGINIICVSGLTLLTGFTGMFSMGHAGFMAIGGYSAAVLHMHLHVPFLLAVLLGGVLAALSSLIVGVPTIKNRLTGDCFAIAMLGFGETVRLLSSNIYPVINGAMGLTGIPKKTTFTVVAAFVVVCLFLLHNYTKSQYGKNLVAVQQQEIAAEMMGIDTVKTKLWSLALSAFFTGMGGALFGFYMTCLYPSNFTSTKSTDLTAAVVFGGTNSITVALCDLRTDVRDDHALQAGGPAGLQGILHPRDRGLGPEDSGPGEKPGEDSRQSRREKRWLIKHCSS